MKLPFCVYTYISKHKEQHNDLLSSPNIIQVIKLGRIGWAGHAVRIGEKVYTQGSGGERDRLEDPEQRWDDLALGIYTWQHVSHLLHVLNHGAGKCSLTTHTNRFRAAAAS